MSYLNTSQLYIYGYSLHSADIKFSTYPPQTNFILRWQSQGTASPLRDRQQGPVMVIRGGRLLYVCIY